MYLDVESDTSSNLLHAQVEQLAPGRAAASAFKSIKMRRPSAIPFYEMLNIAMPESFRKITKEEVRKCITRSNNCENFPIGRTNYGDPETLV